MAVPVSRKGPAWAGFAIEGQISSSCRNKSAVYAVGPPRCAARSGTDHKGFCKIIPSQSDLRIPGGHFFCGEGADISQAIEFGIYYGDLLIAELRGKKPLDLTLQPPGHRNVVCVYLHLIIGYLARQEENMSRTAGG